MLNAKQTATTTPKRRNKPVPVTVTPNHRVIMARHLDVLAGAELQHGHHHAAERLAWRAAELREDVTHAR